MSFLVPVLMGFNSWLLFKKNDVFASGFTAGIACVMLIRAFLEVI